MVLSLLIALAIGFLNGYMVVKSGLPSFIVTLGTFFILRGFNLWFTQRVTGLTNVTGVEATPGSEAARKVFAGTLFTIGNAKFGVAILWFLIMTVIGVVGPHAHPGRQLDLRRRRQPRRRPHDRRPGQRHQDRPVHGRRRSAAGCTARSC